MTEMRVRAVVGRPPIALTTPEGVTVMGRWAGRDSNGNPLPEGQLVPKNAYYLRAVGRGDLELVEDGE
jgi:hypothetical protein